MLVPPANVTPAVTHHERCDSHYEGTFKLGSIYCNATSIIILNTTHTIFFSEIKKMMQTLGKKLDQNITICQDMFNFIKSSHEEDGASTSSAVKRMGQLKIVTPRYVRPAEESNDSESD